MLTNATLCAWGSVWKMIHLSLMTSSLITALNFIMKILCKKFNQKIGALSK